MDRKTRVKKDIDKLEKMIEDFRGNGLDGRYPLIFEYVENYFSDSVHFFENKDYFTAFGAINYAHGFIDTILMIEGKKK